MSFLPVAIAAVGMGMQFKNTIDAGKAQQAAHNYNASVSRTQATMAAESGKLDAYRQRKAALAFSAKQRAAYSKAGVRMIGSPLEVQFSDFADMELEVMIGEMNARNQVNLFMSEAEYAEYLGREARRTSKMAAWGTLLTSAGTMGMKMGAGGATTPGYKGTFGNVGISSSPVAPSGNAFSSGNVRGSLY